MLTRIRGTLLEVSDETAKLLVDPFEIEVLIPEHTRRLIQTKLGEPVAFHTIFYIEGGSMVAGWFREWSDFSRRSTASSSTSSARWTAWACEGASGDGPAGPRAGPDDPGSGRQDARDLPGHRRGDWPSGSSPSCAGRSASSP